ncbi:MAG: RNA-binding S4 domain-containing protein [Terrimicrobiaceae bacterium]
MIPINKAVTSGLDSSSANTRHIVVREVPIELCQFMKFGGLTESGGEAKQLISEGQVLLNGVVETRKRRKLAVGDEVKALGQTLVVKLA